MVRCDRLREHGQARIAIGVVAKIAQNLIVRAVLFDDIDHVVDAVVPIVIVTTAELIFAAALV